MMPHAFTGDAPQVARRLSDQRERNEWERRNINPKNPGISPERQAVHDHYAEVHRLEEERERRWEEDERRRRDAIAARYDAVDANNKQVIENREYDLAMSLMWSGLNASEQEIRHVMRIVGQHPSVELAQLTLMKLRNALGPTSGDADVPDWRGF